MNATRRTARLVPRALAALGFVGYTALLASGLLEITGYGMGSLLFVPGGLFEAILPIWLIVRGFRGPALVSRPVLPQ